MTRSRSKLAAVDDLDVAIVGAGLSGIAAGYYVQSRLPGRRFAIFEARDAIGGTWDLFRYPGVRSDSDMHTLGYSFRPWHGDVALAEGPAIKAYVEETAHAYGLDRVIRFGMRAISASWSSADARWTVTFEDGAGSRVDVRCRFLFMCSGYYNYSGGYLPNWTGVDTFGGTLVHPQAWPANLDVSGRRVVVIGSGATAITLVPALADAGARVTMLQRSPSYVVSLPRRDANTARLYERLPKRLAAALARWKNIGIAMYVYLFSRLRPQKMREALEKLAREQLPPDFDVATHLNPRYNPWDQRLCFAADGDFFTSIREGRANVVTGEIDRFTRDGVRLRTGESIPADVAIAATGLRVQLFGGMSLRVDGAPVDLAQTVAYKGMMFSGLPNLALALGYTNASWTLKCELIARYVCRLIAYMDRHGYAACIPRPPANGPSSGSLVGLSSGYIQRALDVLPKQGPRFPWKMYQNYVLDLAALRFGRVNDGVMRFARR